jgi:hypothetical protein
MSATTVIKAFDYIHVIWTGNRKAAAHTTGIYFLNLPANSWGWCKSAKQLTYKTEPKKLFSKNTASMDIFPVLSNQLGNSFLLNEIWGSHSRKFWDYRRIDYDVVQFGRWVPRFRKRLPLPSKEQMVEIGFSEIFVISYQTIRRHFHGDHDFSIF